MALGARRTRGAVLLNSVSLKHDPNTVWVIQTLHQVGVRNIENGSVIRIRVAQTCVGY